MNVQQGVCPICNGTAQVPLTEEEKKYSWCRDRTHIPCNNCGGQTMSQKATGKVRLRPDTGEPCVHLYETSNPHGWRCYVQYTCIHCGETHAIDSSD